MRRTIHIASGINIGRNEVKKQSAQNQPGLLNFITLFMPDLTLPIVFQYADKPLGA